MAKNPINRFIVGGVVVLKSCPSGPFMTISDVYEDSSPLDVECTWFTTALELRTGIFTSATLRNATKDEITNGW